MLQRLTMLCFFFGIANSRRCNREESGVCCPGFMLNETTNQCTHGYFGIKCRSCPFPYFGNGCTSICNCMDGEQCDHILGCTKTQGSGPEERTSVSSFSLPQSITTTHLNGSTKIKGILTKTSRLQPRNTLTGTKGLRNCSEKGKHLGFSRDFLSVTTACFTSISGVFLVLYAGLHFYKLTSYKPSTMLKIKCSCFR
uniref:Multiple epidermal growth factor-like domains protein 11 isoform X2 n=1 Tax=Crassostrea virginica TaxID=6565 RepID=A0A8B8AT08_CRAVI|nr:multiple epidermal growth factor-like domains protein 11 isoform X2 [Crassostrea virginica]